MGIAIVATILLILVIVLVPRLQVGTLGALLVWIGTLCAVCLMVCIVSAIQQNSGGYQNTKITEFNYMKIICENTDVLNKLNEDEKAYAIDQVSAKNLWLREHQEGSKNFWTMGAFYVKAYNSLDPINIFVNMEFTIDK